jgi:hypothetical protein
MIMNWCTKSIMLVAQLHSVQYHTLSRDNSVGDPGPVPKFSWENPNWSSGSVRMNVGPSYGSGGYIGTYGSGSAGGTFSPPVNPEHSFGVE